MELRRNVNYKSIQIDEHVTNLEFLNIVHSIYIIFFLFIFSLQCLAYKEKANYKDYKHREMVARPAISAHVCK